MRRALSNATVYSALQRLLGADAARRHLVDEHLRPARGERLLDLGCGPGDLLDALPAVEYVGVDLSPGYLAAARRRGDLRATFRLADARELRLDGGEGFDGVVAVGLLHHLDDAGVRTVAAVAARALRPEGRFVTMDPGTAPGQSRFARALARRDRGRHVRTAAGYRTLVEGSFRSVRPSVRHDLARLPYTHVILECQRPVAEET